MIHKTLITASALLLVLGVVKGRDAWSYLSTACGQVSRSVEEGVPIEFQIERARKMVADLTPEVRDSMQVIAREEIELERLNQQIQQAEEASSDRKEAILRLQSDLGGGGQVFHYAGRSYSEAQVREDLSRRFTRFKIDAETLKHLTTMRDARQRNLDAARQKLTAMVAAQKNLEADLTNLEAQQKLVTVAQASSDLVFDDSQLARAKELISDLRTRLDVAAKLASVDVSIEGEIALDEADSTDVSDQVADYFGLGAAEETHVAADTRK